MKKSLIVKLKVPLGRDISVNTTTQNHNTLNKPQAAQSSSAGALTTHMAKNNGGVILWHFRDIARALRLSSELTDRDTSMWIDKKYLDPPFQLGEEVRWIRSSDDFNKLFDAYQQAVKLTDGVKPVAWPFFHREKKMELSAADSTGSTLQGAIHEPEPELGREPNPLPNSLPNSLPRVAAVTDQREAAKNSEELTGKDVDMTDANQGSVSEATHDSNRSIHVVPKLTVDTTASNAAGIEQTADMQHSLNHHKSAAGVNGDALTRSATADDMVAPLTAAHSDPITTNLDSRPSAATRKKRNSEPQVPTPNKKAKRGSTNSTRGRGRGRPRKGPGARIWRSMKDGNSEGGEGAQVDVGAEPVTDAGPAAPLSNAVEDGDGKEDQAEHRVTRRSSARLSGALARGETPTLGSFLGQSDDKGKNGKKVQVGKKKGVGKVNKKASMEGGIQDRQLHRLSEATAPAYQTQAAVPHMENPNDTKGPGTNPDPQASEPIFERETSATRKHVFDVLTPQSIEFSNKALPVPTIRRSNDLPVRSMPPPAAAQQSTSVQFGAVNGNDVSWNKAMDMPPNTSKGITTNGSSTGLFGGTAGGLSSGGLDGVQNEVSTIELFARVRTAAGTTEVPVSTENVLGDLDVIKRYGEWKQQEEGMSLTFDQFVKVIGFARKG